MISSYQLEYAIIKVSSLHLFEPISAIFLSRSEVEIRLKLDSSPTRAALNSILSRINKAQLGQLARIQLFMMRSLSTYMIGHSTPVEDRESLNSSREVIDKR